jgi:hypothetical protein
MTPLESGQPLSALALLTGQDGRPGDVIDHAPLSVAIGRNLGALQMLPSGTLTAAVGEVSAAASGLLDVSLIGMLVAGWRAHHDLTMAARRTQAAPGITELVRLATHEITVTLRPSVTVLVDGRRMATLDLDLSVVLDVTALLAGVRDGWSRSAQDDVTSRPPWPSGGLTSYPGRPVSSYPASSRSTAASRCSPPRPIRPSRDVRSAGGAMKPPSSPGCNHRHSGRAPVRSRAKRRHRTPTSRVSSELWSYEIA